MINEKAVFQYQNRKYYFSDIVTAIKEAGIRSGDVVFVHSDVGKFGRLADIKDRVEFNRVFLNACLEAIGNNGTLVVPTFTYSFCNNQIFDYYNSPSGLNYFTEVARTTEGFIRSEEPIFSVSCKGPRTHELIDNLSTTCLGKDSIFERFHAINGKFLLLGWYLGPTFIHYIEAANKVPYRYDKTFKGIIKKGEIQIEKSYIYNVRDLDLNPQLALDELEKTAIESGCLHKTNFGSNSIMTINAVDLFRITKEMLTKNPYALVTIPDHNK